MLVRKQLQSERLLIDEQKMFSGLFVMFFLIEIDDFYFLRYFLKLTITIFNSEQLL